MAIFLRAQTSLFSGDVYPEGTVSMSKVYPHSHHWLGTSSHLESRELEVLVVNKLHFSTECAVQYSLPSSARQICHLPDGSKGRSVAGQPAATFCRPALVNTALSLPWPCMCSARPMGSARLGHHPPSICLALWACPETLCVKREFQPHTKLS